MFMRKQLTRTMPNTQGRGPRFLKRLHGRNLSDGENRHLAWTTDALPTLRLAILVDYAIVE